ncbi:hypothetical protein N9140_01065 [bacterium]|nr:hypothetical protein [bacterium]
MSEEAIGVSSDDDQDKSAKKLVHRESNENGSSIKGDLETKYNAAISSKSSTKSNINNKEQW